jgi:hypothetical protein
MPDPVRICDLQETDRQGRKRPLDLTRSDTKDNVSTASHRFSCRSHRGRGRSRGCQGACGSSGRGGGCSSITRWHGRAQDTDVDYASNPPSFRIPSMDDLREWDAQKRPVPPKSHNSGNTTHFHKHRAIHHPDDPLGLVADKLARAIADLRVDERTGQHVEPVFVHVYSLGHAAVMRQIDKGLELLGCGAFHAAVEAYGVEWSYGYNEMDATGLFPSPPKCGTQTERPTRELRGLAEIGLRFHGMGSPGLLCSGG